MLGSRRPQGLPAIDAIRLTPRLRTTSPGGERNEVWVSFLDVCWVLDPTRLYRFSGWREKGLGQDWSACEITMDAEVAAAPNNPGVKIEESRPQR
jgi:hypothetical protein